MEKTRTKVDIQFITPSIADAKHVWTLVNDTNVLDKNSAYLYLLLCTHHKDTCVVAKHDDTLVGFATGYVLPEEPSILFIWQMAVDESMRGQGIAGNLIKTLLKNQYGSPVSTIHATVSPSNTASLNVFKKLATQLKAPISITPYFDVSDFPDNTHEKEDLISIGPIKIS